MCNVFVEYCCEPEMCFVFVEFCCEPEMCNVMIRCARSFSSILSCYHVRFVFAVWPVLCL